MNEILTQEKSIYIQIKEMIEDDILRDVLLEEERVPSTNELACFIAITKHLFVGFFAQINIIYLTIILKKQITHLLFYPPAYNLQKTRCFLFAHKQARLSFRIL